MLHKLSRLAEVHAIAVVVAYPVQSQSDDFSAGLDALRATGGNVMGHTTTDCSESPDSVSNNGRFAIPHV